jgi:hypothetical protein
MAIHVLATSVAGTRAALSAAKPIAERSGLPVVLMIPARPDHRDANWLVAGYEQIARDVGQPVRVRVGVSSSTVASAMTLTPPNETVIIGGRSRWWWPSVEERTAAALRRAGRQVLFVGCSLESSHA